MTPIQGFQPEMLEGGVCHRGVWGNLQAFSLRCWKEGRVIEGYGEA